MKTVAKILPHISIILAGLLIVLFIADLFNGSMGFLTSDGAKALMLMLSVTSIINAGVLIAGQRRREQMGN